MSDPRSNKVDQDVEATTVAPRAAISSSSENSSTKHIGEKLGSNAETLASSAQPPLDEEGNPTGTVPYPGTRELAAMRARERQKPSDNFDAFKSS